MNIFVARLDYSVQDDELRQLFEAFGTVDSAKVIMDKDTGRSKGFGFVEMPEDNEGQNAINDLDGQELKGRNIVVKKARPREDNRGGGFNRGGGGGGYRGGGGYGRDRY
jgi:RNA recognition motif-containing protein